MPRHRAWDVLVVSFPFTDQGAVKVRPAVVVSTDALSKRVGKLPRDDRVKIAAQLREYLAIDAA